MAVSASNLSRRGILGVLALTPIAISAPAIAENHAAPSGGAWERAHQGVLAALETETHYDRAVWSALHDRADMGGAAVPDHVNNRMERLVEARCDAEEALFTTPAPTVDAVLIKVERAKAHYEGMIIPEAFLDAIAADLRRIGGAA